jgi:S1-C subfamily serine protease
MAEPYGAVVDYPEPGSPAASAGTEIEKDDVVTAINGSPIMRLSEFAQTIADMAPGSPVYLTTWRNGENIEIRLTLGSARCRTNGSSAIARRDRDLVAVQAFEPCLYRET